MITSITGFAQTKKSPALTTNIHEIPFVEVRIANQIFVEHKNQKEIIIEQDRQIKSLEHEIKLTEDKTTILVQKVETNEKEIQVIHEISATEKSILNNKLISSKKSTKTYKIATFAIAAILGLFIIQ